MRQIGFIDTESQARVFRSYLLTLGMHSDVDQAGDKRWAVWVHEETRLDEGRRELEQFVADPRNARYQAGAAVGKEIEKTAEKENKRFKNRHVDMRTQWHKSQMMGGTLTLVLIFASVALTALMYMPGWGGFIKQWFSIMAYQYIDNRMVYNRSEPLDEVLHGQVWRLITPIFLHFGIMHILFNMLWLKMLGGAVEAVEGTGRLALHVLLYAIAGNVFQLFLTAPNFGGMSGVNYGLFAYVWLVGKYSNDQRYYIDPLNLGLMLFWFFACLFGWIPNVANGAHGAGLVLGAVWATIHLRRIPFTNVRF